MPALTLDAAFVHLNLGDAHGNAAYTGIDPYFDDLYLMAAEKRFLSVERVVLDRRVDQGRSAAGTLINRMMVDAVVEAPNGAHFTTAEPDYRRDEKFQRHYAEAAGVRRDVGGVRRDLSVRERGRLPGGRAQVHGRPRRPRSELRDPCRGVRRRVRRTVPRRRRDHGQPDDHHGVDRRPAGPADVLPRHPADRRRGPADRRHPGDRRRRLRSRAGCRSAGSSRPCPGAGATW